MSNKSRLERIIRLLDVRTPLIFIVNADEYHMPGDTTVYSQTDIDAMDVAGRDVTIIRVIHD